MVDDPANLREFLVVKRLEDNMGAFELDSGSGVDPSQIGLAIEPATDSIDADLAAVTEYLTKAKASDEEGVTKAVPADLKAAIMRVMQFLGKVAGDKYPQPTSKATGEENEETMKARHKQEVDEAAKRKAAGAQGEDEETMKARHKQEADEVTKRKAAADKAEAEKQKAAADKAAAEKTQGVTKAAAGGDTPPVPHVQIFEDGRVVVAGQPVNKARAFTAGRTKQIAQVTSALMTLLKDVDQDELNKLLGTNAPEQPAKSSTPATQGVAKSADGAQDAAKPADGEGIDQVITLLKGLGDRVEAIEKARTPSTSVEGDGQTQQVQKSQKFWDGVL